MAFDHTVLHETSPPRRVWHLRVVADEAEIPEIEEHLREFHFDHIRELIVTETGLLVCMDWIGEEIANLVGREITNTWFGAKIEQNEEVESCQGHP